MNENNSQFIILNQLLVFLVTRDEQNISSILTQIRALKGVVTLSVFEKTKKINEKQELTKIRIKFLAAAKTIRMALKLLKLNIQQISGVDSVVLKIKKTVTPASQNQNSGGYKEQNRRSQGNTLWNK